MKKVIQLTAVLVAATVFSSAPALALQNTAVNAVIAHYQTLSAQYQSQNLTKAQADSQALLIIQSEIQAMLVAAADQPDKEALLQAALEAAAALCVASPADPALNLTKSITTSPCDELLAVLLAAASAAAMSADSIAAVAAASAGVDQDLIAQATASGGAGRVAGLAAAPGTTGFGGGSGGGGGTASGN